MPKNHTSRRTTFQGADQLLFMALLSIVDSTPRAYWLKAGNAD